ncbi:Ppx/GppA phosphatase family protein [Cohnella sp. JJ-181]|uniref:Ppx/GppA phosphatase family protein n=1 Tax=Cohnella rhizoplanae TaxID=2974897 RepID=UPI0022FF7E22|nr:Ppx/GppA phosphatase family protein [Cohnella sp. JJ-181]CAI6044986.1 Guanosine-5'-triphosphate,3'-diphosphate pyrophosphatase [Cohnella sp. JJ-181]
MSFTAQTTGMIDIGSNTVRLSVYRVTEEGAYRVIDQGRWPARLSQRLTGDGRLPAEAVSELGEVLRHYKRICRIHGVERIRTVATAALRQAANRDQALSALFEETGLTIELLPGEEEARLGSLAMLRTMNIEDGFVIDIGGGSTEITLLRDRRIVSSVSFPIGCVNTSTRFGLGEDPVARTTLDAMESDIRDRLSAQEWIAQHPGLPVIGLGGTVRALAKLRQRLDEYPFANLHGYEIPAEGLSSAIELLAPLTVDKRRKLPGLSKDRADVIVPGLVILQAVLRACRSARIVVCGAGLRDGLFYDTCLPDLRLDGEDAVAEEGIRNLLALYPGAPASHLQQVNRLSLALYDQLAPDVQPPAEGRRLLSAASRLFRIGAVIDYNDCAQHTFYMLMHAHWNGMSHREILLVAAIASYRNANALKRSLANYRTLIRAGDEELAAKLGMLLQLAAALDRSESQAITSLSVSKGASGRLLLEAAASHALPVETTEVQSLAKDFKKCWGLTPSLRLV